jgi:ketosteroid isomerase-like protein
VVVAGDVALMSAGWSMSVGFGAGEAAALEGNSTEVARRQGDGGWLYVIDRPELVTGRPSS